MLFYFEDGGSRFRDSENTKHKVFEISTNVVHTVTTVLYGINNKDLFHSHCTHN
jgi:hypothetical protein